MTLHIHVFTFQLWILHFSLILQRIWVLATVLHCEGCTLALMSY